jgi:hypothetical protein
MDWKGFVMEPLQRNRVTVMVIWVEVLSKKQTSLLVTFHIIVYFFIKYKNENQKRTLLLGSNPYLSAINLLLHVSTPLGPLSSRLKSSILGNIYTSTISQVNFLYFLPFCIMYTHKWFVDVRSVVSSCTSVYNLKLLDNGQRDAETCRRKIRGLIPKIVYLLVLISVTNNLMHLS